MIYEKYFNKKLFQKVNNTKNTIVYGQNITLGSSLSGLSKAPKKLNKDVLVINSINSENSLVGMGMGLMISGTNSVFITKQQDFLVLSFDHLVSTVNALKERKCKNFFNIISIAVNSGFEGPQSCLNNSNDFYSISGINTFNLNTKNEVDIFFKYYFNKSGVKIINVAQNLFKKEIINFKIKNNYLKNNNCLKYSNGSHVTLVGFNFSINKMKDTNQYLKLNNINSTIFSYFFYKDDILTNEIISNLNKTKILVLFDDSKSKLKYSDKFLSLILLKYRDIKIFDFRREISSIIPSPNHDQYTIKTHMLNKLINYLKKNV